MGSFCTVLCPANETEFSETVPRIANQADIVVLDWGITDLDGDDTLEVMRGIIAADSESMRSRLFAIYTSQPELTDIVEKVRELIDEFYPREQLLNVGSFTVSKGPVRVVVLAKLIASSQVRTEFRDQSVDEEGLPDRLIDEFAKMTSGLLRNVVLVGLAEIRAQTHRLLSAFDPQLDPAYLGHRLAIPFPPDSEDHVVDVLVSELASMLENAQAGRIAGILAIRAWLDAKTAKGLELHEPFDDVWNQDDYCDRLIEIHEMGFEYANKRFVDGAKVTKSKWNKVKKNATAIFSTDADVTNANQRFAALMDLKSRFGSADEPILTLGTVLKRRSDQRYFVSIQPKCDSVRLREKTAFPLLPIRFPNENQGSDLVVCDSDSEWINLKFATKPSELLMVVFEPGIFPPGEVKATVSGYGLGFFAANGDWYEFVVEIKDEQASEIASKLASALARPGPNRAEWLRLSSGR